MKIEVETIEQKVKILKESEYIHYFHKRAFDKKGKKINIHLNVNQAGLLMHLYTNPSLIEVLGDKPFERLLSQLVDEFWNQFDFKIEQIDNRYVFYFKKESLIVENKTDSTWEDYRQTKLKVRAFFNQFSKN